MACKLLQKRFGIKNVSIDVSIGKKDKISQKKNMKKQFVV
jgi:hypothetical protein